jgi:hypothetical protein
MVLERLEEWRVKLRWQTRTPGRRLLVMGPGMVILLILLSLVLGPVMVHSWTTFYIWVAVGAVVFVVSASISALAVIRIGQERRAGLIRAHAAPRRSSRTDKASRAPRR